MNLTDLDFSMLLYNVHWDYPIQHDIQFMFVNYLFQCVPDAEKSGKRQNERGQTNYLCKLNKIRSHFEACYRLIW